MRFPWGRILKNAKTIRITRSVDLLALHRILTSCSSGAQQSSQFRPVQPRDTASSRSPCWPPRRLHARLYRSPVVYDGTPRPPNAILDESCINRIRAPALRALRGCSRKFTFWSYRRSWRCERAPRGSWARMRRPWMPSTKLCAPWTPSRDRTWLRDLRRRAGHPAGSMCVTDCATSGSGPIILSIT